MKQSISPKTWPNVDRFIKFVALSLIATGSFARCARRRYLIYSESEADFMDFRPAEATRCTDGDEIWHGGCQSIKEVTNFLILSAGNCTVTDQTRKKTRNF